ncbi:MAG: D-alanine--D-alanine ligase [Candidatus Puniceispirillum sp.]|nr:D-alanine--D-alanine ligase [Candidatus Pelagibacter sp.]MBA4283630.1 D-alanine--D-alanine ligase [Candidatus Puniceispirillum sp.]
MNLKDKKVCVLYGGWSFEREVSLVSGLEVYKSLKDAGYSVFLVDVKKDIYNFIDEITANKPDVIFNALHGAGGEDGVIQGVLTMLDIPYTHSGVFSSAVAMDKISTRYMLQPLGIPFAQFRVFKFHEFQDNVKQYFGYPFVAKPPCEGSSIGVSIIKNDEELDIYVKNWKFGETVLAEEYCKGREIQVAVMEDKILGSVEIESFKEFYDYEAKYTPGFTKHTVNPTLSHRDMNKLYEYALKSHQGLKCNGITRIDFICEIKDAPQDRNMILLEVNTQPGMTPLSLVPEIAADMGMSYLSVIETYLTLAFKRSSTGE